MAALSGSITLAVAVLVLAEVYTLVAGITLPDTDRLSTGGGIQPLTEQDTDALVEEGWDATFSWILSGSPGRNMNKNNSCLLHASTVPLPLVAFAVILNKTLMTTNR